MPDLTGQLANLWKRIMLRNIQFADAHGRLDLLYKLPDPWGMEGAGEQHRFEQTAEFLKAHASPIDTLLEIGCGEGHQTRVFAVLARAVTGVDVSDTAVQRARRRVPSAEFFAGDVMALPAFAARRFDVVTACEVLYYLKDPKPLLEKIETLGRTALVTYVHKYKDALDPIILSKPGLVHGEVQFEETTWTIALWPTGR